MGVNSEAGRSSEPGLTGVLAKGTPSAFSGTERTLGIRDWVVVVFGLAALKVSAARWKPSNQTVARTPRKGIDEEAVILGRGRHPS